MSNRLRLSTATMPKFTLRDLFVYITLIGILLAVAKVIVSSFTTPREATRRSSCTNNLKQIGIALHNYLDEHKRFPPAYIADADGIPMHSWRVLILPYMDDPAMLDLYRQYDFSEPWDGPNNSKLVDKLSYLFRCPSDDPNTGETNYVAIVGSQTGWPNAESRSVTDFRDGLSNTIAVTEIADSGISWLEPRDVTFEQAIEGINPPLSKLSVSSAHRGGATCLFFDGSVHFLQDSISPDLFRGLLTVDGGEDVSSLNE